MIKVMIADDQELIRQSLQIIVQRRSKKNIQILKSLFLPLLMMMNLSLVL